MIITQKQLNKTIYELNTIVKIYKRKYSGEPQRDWRTYEQRLAHRIKQAAEEIKPVIEQAWSMIEVSKTDRGRPSKMSITQKVLLLLLKDIFQLSNRKMANLLAFFSAFTGIDISYKSIERCYSEELVRLTVHNMFVILTKKAGIAQVDACGDATGYSLTITAHYRNEREKELKKQVKGRTERKPFIYAFALTDLATGMYIGYGTSMLSEKEAFRKAVAMAGNTGISINSIRLDKYYSYRSIVHEFEPGTKFYIIPKRNATIRGPPEWKRMLQVLREQPFSFLKEYYKRNKSESGFSTDKRMSGWKIWQQREERIDTALLCKGVWHNLLLLG